MNAVLARVSRLISDPNPILVKELRAIFRTKLYIRFLYLATGLVGLIVLSTGALSATGPTPPAEVGNLVFQFFFCTSLLIIALIAPAYASATFTVEKETKTYESLVLTGMKPWRIVRGKFIASFASILLVLVSFGPVVGIAFLFGGISPWNVLGGYYGLLLVLAPAIAFGVAISARLSSTRVAILVTVPLFVIIAFFGTGILWALGEQARSRWGIGMGGPFWFTEALADRFTEPDTFLLLGVLPLYVFGMTVWFLLASAVAGIRSPAEDRSTPFKVWAAVAVLGTIVAIYGMTTLFGSAEDAGWGGVMFSFIGTLFLLFLSLMFSNEPPLPPRLAEQSERRGVMRTVAVAIGPGAAPTARFGALVTLLGAVLFPAAAALARHVTYPGDPEHAKFDAALQAIAIGNVGIGLFLVYFGAWLRAVLRSGIAARVLTLAVLFGLTVLPFLGSLIIDPDSLDRLTEDMPVVVRFSPIAHLLQATGLGENEMQAWRVVETVPMAVGYALAGALFFVLLELRVRRVRQAVEEQRRQMKERADLRAAQFEMRRSSVPPGDLLPTAPEDEKPADRLKEAAETVKRLSQPPPPSPADPPAPDEAPVDRTTPDDAPETKPAPEPGAKAAPTDSEPA